MLCFNTGSREPYYFHDRGFDPQNLMKTWVISLAARFTTRSFFEFVAYQYLLHSPQEQTPHQLLVYFIEIKYINRFNQSL